MENISANDIDYVVLFPYTATSFPGLCYTHSLVEASSEFSSGIEKPREFWARNESVTAENSAAVSDGSSKNK